MRWTKVAGTLVAAAALVVGLAGSALSAAPLWEDFQRKAGDKAKTVTRDTPWGGGWRADRGGSVGPGQGQYLKYPAQGVLNPAQGTVEVEVIRDNAKDEMEAFFTLLDANEKTILAMQVNWDRPDRGRPTLEIATDERFLYTVINSRLYGSQDSSEFAMPSIGNGQKAHIVFTWGRKDTDITLYVNGSKIDAKVDDPDFIIDVIRQAKWIVIGAQPRAGGGATSQSRSVITKFYVYDQVLDGAQLSATPEQFRPSSEKAPSIAAVSHDAARVAGFSGKIVANDTVTVTLTGDVGAAGSFDLVHYPDVGGSLLVDWRGWGVYLEDKKFYEEGEVNLRDVDGYDVFAANEPFDPAAPGREPLAILKTQEQSYQMDLLTADTPYYVAVVARMRDGSRRNVIAPTANLPLVESAPGVYTGTFKAGWADRYPRVAVVGRLTQGTLSSTLSAPDAFVIDPTLTMAMASAPAELKADEKSTAKISLTVTNANGIPVSGHEVKFLLATTSQYTGVVGGGAFAEQVGGSLPDQKRAETDLFGQVTVTYVAGFAAKTAIIVARDMLSNSTGTAYVTTFIQATASLELKPVPLANAEEGYLVTVTSSDEWLTADGKSQARITAKVTLAGKPIEGHAVRFSVSSGGGTVRAIKDTTDRSGEARAVYTAGKKIGIALVTATDTTVGVSGSVAIELRSDAPAKIAITIDPASLIADGSSSADVEVLVTDINDNPNDNVKVEYRIVTGGDVGQLRGDTDVTDRKGMSSMEYRAGTTPGPVSFEITVRSTVPTLEELMAARNLSLAVTDYNFF